MFYLTIIVPVYNETNTILKILNKIANIKLKKQIIIVDDGSTDGTREKLIKIKKKGLKILFHKNNLG